MNNLIIPLPRRTTKLDAKSLSKEQKFHLAFLLISGKSKADELSKKYGISRQVIEKYGKCLKEKSPMPGNNGRPHVVSEQRCLELRSELQGRRYQLTEDEFLALLQQKAVASANDRNKGTSTVKIVSTRSADRICHNYDLHGGNAEKTTTSRAEACADVRNLLTFAAMNHYMVPNVSNLLCINSDATQFAVGYDCEKKIRVKFAGRRSGIRGPLKDDSGITLFFIKFYLLISAGGYQSDPVYVIADSTMDSGDIDVRAVNGLGIGTQVSNKGYIVFSNTRACNLRFYKWFNSYIVIPFINEIKGQYGLRGDDLSWYQLDGEAKQIECYKDEEMLNQLHNSKIIVGKPPASTTEITQPCDVGHAFIGTKTNNKSIGDKDVESNKHMINKLNETFAEHNNGKVVVEDDEDPLPECFDEEDNNGQSKGINARHKKLAVLGLLRVQMAMQNVLKPTILTDSFKLCGIYPLSLDQMMSQCTKNLTPDEEDTIRATTSYD
jgi:hypothetical protein